MLAPDAEELVVAYLNLTGITPVSFEMPPSPPLPYFLINRLPSGDDMVTDFATISIHCFDATRSLAAVAARRMHTAMKNWTAKIPVQIADGSYVSIDHIDVIETPSWQDYADKEIWRYCGRYHIDLRINQTT